MQPVSGTYELRWQWHRGDDLPAEPRRPEAEPSPVSPEAAPPERREREPALAGAWRRLDEVERDH
jgi:hypothetical protein